MSGPVAIVAAALAALALALSGCGGDGGGSGSDAEDAFSAIETRPTGQRTLAAPRWEPLEILRGSGDAEAEVVVGERAIQWRARWRCQGGDFRLTLDGEPFARGDCPGGREMKTSIRTGSIAIGVEASRPWRLVIEQQVDTPLREPRLPEIASGDAELVASGSFYPIENRGAGAARLYRLPGGELALRLERFRTAANTDLFVWLSRAPRPRTTKQALADPYVQIAPLKSTLGDQNYLVPEGVGPDRIRSVVIWCEPIQVAYTAATLRR